MSEEMINSFAANVLRLGNECRDLSISNAVLRQENEELHKDYESLADEHTKLIDRNKTLKAEVERMEHQVKYWRIEAETDNARWLRSLEESARLRASSFVTAVPVEHYERVVKAGDAVVADLEHLTKSGWFDRCKSVKRWNAAKEGKPSV